MRRILRKFFSRASGTKKSRNSGTIYGIMSNNLQERLSVLAAPRRVRNTFLRNITFSAVVIWRLLFYFSRAKTLQSEGSESGTNTDVKSLHCLLRILRWNAQRMQEIFFNVKVPKRTEVRKKVLLIMDKGNRKQLVPDLFVTCSGGKAAGWSVFISMCFRQIKRWIAFIGSHYYLNFFLIRLYLKNRIKKHGYIRIWICCRNVFTRRRQRGHRRNKFCSIQQQRVSALK